MLNLIPSIHITVANPRRFLERMDEIARESGSFTAHEYPGHSADERFTLSLGFTRASQHRGLSVHIVRDARAKNKVAVEIRTSEWASESYETYCEAADALMKPLLAVYNSEEGTRYRMSITPKEKLEPVLPPVSDMLFKHFTKNANLTNLHVTDWKRFYEFVRRSRSKLSEAVLVFLLVKEGFSEHYATEIAVIYAYLKDFMRPPDAAEILDQYHLRQTTRRIGRASSLITPIKRPAR